MGPDPKIFDDIARVAGGAVNVLSGFQQQMREEIKSRMEEMADRMDLIPREDLDRAEARIASLEARVNALEGKTKPAAKKTPAKKAAAKRKTKTTKTTAAKKPAKKTVKKTASKKKAKK